MASLLDMAQARLQGLLDIPTRAARALVNPTAFSGLLGAPTLPQQQGFAEGFAQLPQRQNMSVLNPSEASYMAGYSAGEPYGLLASVAPFTKGMPVGASIKDVSKDLSSVLKPLKSGDTVDGRFVRSDIPNTSSISASLDDYAVLPGVREVPLNIFETKGKPSYYSVSEEARTKNLANQIKDSKEINPLIVVLDKEGAYILEGGHRFDALRELDAKSMPAMVVVDKNNPPLNIDGLID